MGRRANGALGCALVVLGAVTGANRGRQDATTASLTLAMNGLTFGSERRACARVSAGVECGIETRFTFGPGIALDARLATANGGDTTVRVNGSAPSFMPSALDEQPLFPAPGRTAIVSPFPLEALAAVIRASKTSAAARFARDGAADATLRRANPAPW